MKPSISVKEWVALFEENGMDETRRQQWHKLFEARHPQAHQGFLEWLGLAPERIQEIRSGCKQ